MNEINRVLSAASRRLSLINFIRGVVAAITALLAALILLSIVQRVLGFELPWNWIGYGCAGAVVLSGLVWAVVAHPRRLAVARRVDEGANLKESLSTAIYLAGQSDDPWARATIDTAVQKARGVHVGRAVPITAPRFWPVPLALALSLAVVFIAMPRLDVLGWHRKQVARQEQQTQIIQARQDAQIAQDKIKEMTKDMDLGKEMTEPPAAEKPEPRDPEAIRKSAIKDLTKLSERLEQLRSGDKGQKLDAVKDALKQLKQPGNETAELTKALAQGNFSQAQKELEALKEKAGSANMNEAEKKKLEQQLDGLAKQLEALAKNQEGLEKQLQQAGLDKNLAANPEALQKALENAKNLTPEQKEALSQMAQSQSQCKSAMDGLSKACEKMGQCMSKGDKQGLEKAASGMQGQLSELEQMSQEMSMAEAAQNECKSQIAKLGNCDKEGNGMGESQSGGEGTKPWSQGWNQSRGNGRGGPGLGQGGHPGSEQASFETEKKKAIGPQGEGPIVGSRMVEGESVKGESSAAFMAAVASAEQSSTESIEQNQIPREFHDAIKNYFGTLKSKGGAAGAKDAKPAAPAKPVEPAKDAKK